MNKKIATIILNRNLPEVTDRLYDHIFKYDGEHTDIYVLEAGSDINNLSRYTSWYANSDEVLTNGLRYCRGMNYGLVQLINEGKFSQYDSFFLLTNDTEFEETPTISPLLNVMNQHPRLGILSPCSKQWGERFLLNGESTKYFWFIHNNAYLVRRNLIESICNLDNPDIIDFLFDGNNFRGYGTEHELIAKAYSNDWAAGITNLVWAKENETYLKKYSKKIKTQTYEENLNLYIEEGRCWMRKKYGFNSHWAMQQYVKYFYDKFFEFHPEYINYKL